MIKKIFYFIFINLVLMGCNDTHKELVTVKNVDLNRYAGTWYEIARFDHTFERGLKCVTATYSLKDNGKIGVLNRGVKENDSRKVSSAEAVAWLPNPNETGKLKVQFMWPFRADYYIVHLDTLHYNHVIVGTPSRNYLWIMSRTPFMNKNTYDSLCIVAEGMQFDISKLQLVKQDCN